MRWSRTPWVRVVALLGWLASAGASLTPRAPGVEAAVGADAGLQQQRVIIHLAAGPDTKVALATTSGPVDGRRLAAVADAIAHGAAELEATIPGSDLTIYREFLLQPAVAASVTDDGLAMLRSSPVVRLVEPDRRWHPLTQEGLPMIGADILHDQGIAGEGTAVAIIDTGVDYLHPTLGGGQIPNAKVIYGLDTADSDDDPMDCDGHGTAVASVAAGSSYQWSPGRVFAGGVAPAAKILAYKVTGDDDCRSATTSTVVAALEDAVLRRTGDDYQLAAINISLGGGAYSGPCDSDNVAYAEAVNTAVEAGITVVASAGNDGFTDTLAAPACLTRAIAVGSAWDTDPGAVGYVFCLDQECTQSCDDSFRWQGAVACYSNSSAYLDLIAPSEYLRASAAGGVTVDFGGTSGAAAYVSGAAALLTEVMPGANPATVRFLLAASGRPTMDDRNGLVRPIINLADAVDAASRVAVAGDTSVPILSYPEPPLTSSLWVDQDGTVGNVEVFVNLAHPRPDELSLILTSPDGTEVILHDRGPGTTPETVAGLRFDGIAGSYPNDLEPAQSLGRFHGVTSRGWWTLTVEDHGDGSGGSASAELVGWALEVFEPVGQPLTDRSMVFPVVARTDGVNDTVWRSDVRIFNASDRREAELRLLMISDAVQGQTEIRQTDVVVPHGSVLALDDVVGSRFGLESGRGSLLVNDPTGEVVHGSSRTFTIGDDGTYGQFIAPMAGTFRSTGAGEPPLVLLPTGGDNHRVNVGCTEVSGAGATVAITLVDSASGVTIGPSTFLAVEPNQNLQINGVLPDIDLPPTADPYLTVTVVNGSGRVAAYASVIDNRTGDAVFIPGSRPEIRPSLLIPVVARVRGEAGTEWRSDIRVLNHGSFSVHVDAELRFQDAVGLPPVVRTFELRPAEAASFEDVVGSLFSFDEVQGSLRLVPREGPAALCAVSRTANQVAEGTYGQFIPAIAEGQGIRHEGALIHLAKNDRARTNVGIVEADGKGVSLRLLLHDEIGRPMGYVNHLTLGSWESVQINDVFAAMGAPPRDNARLEIAIEGGAGNFFAYASVVDADSGDAIFVPALDVQGETLSHR